MAIEQVDIEKFLKLSEQFPVFDVRSPGEFSHAHIPGAQPLPLFTDDQRSIIGTIYKKESRQLAVDKGLEFFSVRMKTVKQEVEDLINQSQKGKEGEKHNYVLLHCWRGGMRSGAVAWLLNLYGYKVYTLKGGYKSFRNWALAQFEKEYKINILGGFTGSGKTEVLHEMKTKGFKTIDLEFLANHKGSTFGSLGEKPQPGQEMFENLLAVNLYKSQLAERSNDNDISDADILSQHFWLEDESRHIGSVGIPKLFWEQMRKSQLYFLDIPFEERLKHIVTIYGAFKKQDLVTAIMRVQKRLGGLETKNAINYLLENNTKECFSILLQYYDKLYKNSLDKRESLEAVLNKIPCNKVDKNNLIFFTKSKPAGIN
ncbi:MAG: tRNA 2-selenouridine(34) synthase MnmH [Bacteroidota bacterium]|nr:tRNA 2-selenouridine(34) synthase MnmH [Bacteroidota bacterium]